MFAEVIKWINGLPHIFLDIMWVLFVFLSTIFLAFIDIVIYRRIKLRLEKTKRIWDDALIYAFHRPFHIFIWLLGISYICDILYKATYVFHFLKTILVLRSVFIVILVFWLFVRFVRCMSLRLVHPSYVKNPFEKTTVDAISKLIIVVLVVISGLFILHYLGIPVPVVTAFGGGGAIIAGLSARDLLANFFGGLMIFLDRPFSVGDWIKSPDREIEGTVEHIGWRLTRIRTFDKRPLYIPNSIFSSIAIINPSRMTNRRIRTVFGVRYADAGKVADIVVEIEEMLRNHPEVDTRMALFAALVEFAPSSLNILVYTFTKTTQWVKFQSIQQDVFLKIIDIVYNKHGAQMAFPTYTLNADNEFVNIMRDSNFFDKDQKQREV